MVLLDRDGDAGEQSAQRLGDAASAMQLDVSVEADVDRSFDAVVARLGRIDVLVNNAGMALRKNTVDLALHEWQQVVDVNMTGAFLCARAAARQMLKQGSGAIVNTASIMGVSGSGLYPHISYQATKGALVNMTRAWAVEWAMNGIRVNAVAPTWIDTDFIGGLKDQPELMERIRAITPMDRIAQPRRWRTRSCSWPARPPPW